MYFKPFAQAALPLLLSLSALAEGGSTSRVTQAMQKYMGAGGPPQPSNNVYDTDFKDVTWDQDGWTLMTTRLESGKFESRGSVANGYLGINVASVGPFFERDDPSDGGDIINGWPLYNRRQTFATIAGFWDSQQHTESNNFPWLTKYDPESVISGVPHWAGLILDVGNGQYLDSSVENNQISNFHTSYDFKAGVLSWEYTWTPSGNSGSYDIIFRMFANKLYVNQAVVDMEVTASKDGSATIVNLLDGDCAVRSDFVDSGDDAGTIYSAVRPHGIQNVTAYIYANMVGSSGADMSSRKVITGKPYISGNASTIAQGMNVNFKAGKAVQITKYVGGASSDAFSDPQQVAKAAAATATKNGYAQALRSHVSEWEVVMPESSVDSYTYPENGTLPNDKHIIDNAIISVTNTYYLLQNTASQNAIKQAGTGKINVDSIAVGGLTSDSYGGQIFWDADVWMQPGLTASNPEAAQRISNYRAQHYDQALANIATKYAGSQNDTWFAPDAAIYPWTSARYGRCTAVGPCWDYEYHINGDIGLALINQLMTSGDTQTFKDKLFPIYDSAATLYADLLVRNGSSWTLLNMTDPDEYANHVNAGGYTMPLIAETLWNANAFRKEFGLEPNQTWNEMAANVLVIRENGVTLEFTTMNGSAVVKQADVVLDTYPLAYTANYTQQDSLNDLDYYANKQSPDGPAMTWAIFSVVANEMSPSGCSAYTYQQYSYRPYTRAPFFQLSEQMIDDANLNGGTHPAYPFLTGHGGANQVGLMGYLGLRLLPSDYLHVDPNMPPQIPHLKYRTFYWRGWPISAWSNYTHTTMMRDSQRAPLSTADPRFAKAITIRSGSQQDYKEYQLPSTGSVVIPNRMVASHNTVAGNLVQCQPVQSTDDYQPGQFPLSAVDGATSTKWQPKSASKLSSVTVSFGPEAGSMVHGFEFQWAQAPPVNATVLFHNKTIADPAMAYKNNQNSEYQVVTSLHNIKQSAPYTSSTNLNIIEIPTGNSTNVTLSHPVPAANYASLLIEGNQAQESTGATVAEWSILGKDSGNTARACKRKIDVRAAAALSDMGSFTERRRQALPVH